MKCLTLVALLASASAIAAYAEDSTFCTFGMLSNPLQTFTGGATKSGNLCVIPDGQTIQFDGKTTPATTGGPATMDLSYGSIGAGGMVWVVGPDSEAVAATTVPYIVKVANVFFNENAFLAIQGSFGKGSDISISSCTFTVNKPQTPFAGIGAYGVLFFENGIQRLYQDAKVHIFNNDFTIHSDPSNFTAMAIGGISQIKMDAGSAFEIYRNTIKFNNERGGASSAFGIGFTNTIVTQSDGVPTNFTIAGNTISTRYGTPLYLPEINSPSFPINYNISNNKLTAAPTYAASGNPVVIIARGIMVGRTSVMSLERNTIDSIGSDCLAMTQQITLLDDAVANYRWNKLTAVNGSSAFGFQGVVSIPANGKLIVEENILRKDDDAIPSMPAFYLGSAVSLQGSSVMSISNNDFDVLNHGLDNRQLFVGKAGQDAIPKSSAAKLYICYNRHYGEAMSTIYLSDTVLKAMQNTAECTARATTLPPTTTSTTTTTPTSTTTPTTTPQVPVTRPPGERVTFTTTVITDPTTAEPTTTLRTFAPETTPNFQNGAGSNVQMLIATAVVMLVISAAWAASAMA